MGVFYLELSWVELTGEGKKGLWVFLGGTGRSGGLGVPPETQPPPPPPKFGEERGGTLKKLISKMASG